MATPRRRQQPKGGNYPNRSDLRQAPRAASGQEYGQAKAQIDAQKVVPLIKAPAPGSSPPQVAGMMGGGGQGVVPLSAPSARPNEPLTAGINGGPGPGPEALNMPSGDDTLMAWLKSAYAQDPNDDLARLMAALEPRLDKPLMLPKPQPAPGPALGMNPPLPR